jgi:hypothetical protein
MPHLQCSVITTPEGQRLVIAKERLADDAVAKVLAIGIARGWVWRAGETPTDVMFAGHPEIFRGFIAGMQGR